MRPSYSSAIRGACEEIVSGFGAGDIVRQKRAWKLFLLLSRMVLCRPRRGGYVPKKELEQTMAIGRTASAWPNKLPGVCSRRGRRHNSDAVEARAVRAEKLVQLGEVSAGRQALESARVAPGMLATLRALTKQQRRPPLPRDPLAANSANAMPESPFGLDFDRFVSNIRSAKWGSALGPSGMTVDHLHTVLEKDADVVALFCVAVLFASEAVRLVRITALAKADGRVSGIVVGDVPRRLVARTIPQQIGDRVEEATSPFQFALKARAGCECVSHTLRTLSEMDEATTIPSVDGVGAFDLISRNAMLRGLVEMPRTGSATQHGAVRVSDLFLVRIGEDASSRKTIYTISRTRGVLSGQSAQSIRYWTMHCVNLQRAGKLRELDSGWWMITGDLNRNDEHELPPRSTDEEFRPATDTSGPREVWDMQGWTKKTLKATHTLLHHTWTQKPAQSRRIHAIPGSVSKAERARFKNLNKHSHQLCSSSHLTPLVDLPWTTRQHQVQQPAISHDTLQPTPTTHVTLHNIIGHCECVCNFEAVCINGCPLFLASTNSPGMCKIPNVANLLHRRLNPPPTAAPSSSSPRPSSSSSSILKPSLRTL